MSRRRQRLVSATLVAVFAMLASAAALCLLPCELTPAAHAGATGAKPDHCTGAAVPESAGAALTGTDGSCSDQHAWEPPAAERLASRVTIALTAAVIPPVPAPSTDAELRTAAGMAPGVPATPPPLLLPLRI